MPHRFSYTEPMELRQTVTVGEGGRVELTLPQAAPGEVIDLTVFFERGAPRPRRAGSLRRKVHVGPEFDEPIPGMEAYE